jgi:ribose 5-phosphate isomerase B
MVEDEITTNGEFYVCPIYNLLVNDGLKVRIESVQSMHVLGTPEDLTFFNQRVLPVFGDKPIALCADHSGLELKDRIKSHLDEIGIQYIDFGTYVDADCDHYDFLSPAIKHINDGICNFGMAFCRTGQGFNIAANKAEGIRSALIFDSYTAEYAIRHNAANFFCLPSKYVDDVSSIIFALRASSFEGGRHATRIQRIERDNNVFRA